MLATYSKPVWESLLPFSEARRRARGRLVELGAIGEIICCSGLQDVVGVALIHRHFKLADDERLVEVFRDGGFRILPSSDRDVTPYLWKVAQEPATGRWLWYPIEFVQTAGAPTDAAELAARLQASPELLAELAEAVVRLGVNDIFGLNTLHRDAITPAPGQLLIETNSEVRRTLEVATYPLSVGTEEISPTYWRFEPADRAGPEPSPLQRYEHERAASPEPPEVPDVITLSFQKLLAPTFPAFYRRIALRCLAVREAVDRDLASEPLEVLVDRFRRRRGLRADDAFRAWLDRRGLSRDELASSLRERDRVARLLAAYREREPDLRTRAALYRRLLANLSGSTGLRPRVLLRTQWHVSWDSAMIRDLKWRGKFGPARQTAAEVLRANAEFFAEQSWLPPALLSPGRLEAFFAERWGVRPSDLRAAAQDRGFPRYDDFLEAARYVYVYARRSRARAVVAAV